MPQIQLEDRLFEAAQRRAADGGYASVDEYIADVVGQDIGDDTDDVEHLFTPERLEEIAKAEADVKAGNFYTVEQAKSELAKHRAEWLRTHQS